MYYICNIKARRPCYFYMETEMITCTSGIGLPGDGWSIWFLMKRTKEVLLQVFYYPTVDE